LYLILLLKGLYYCVEATWCIEHPLFISWRYAVEAWCCGWRCDYDNVRVWYMSIFLYGEWILAHRTLLLLHWMLAHTPHDIYIYTFVVYAVVLHYFEYVVVYVGFTSSPPLRRPPLHYASTRIPRSLSYAHIPYISLFLIYKVFQKSCPVIKSQQHNPPINQ